MEITMRPTGRRAGATWVASTGAFLLVAAAAVFVAVQWNRMTPGSRLAVVAVVTGGCFWGGRTLRRTLPATGDVLFHLGAFLLPVDLAAVGVQAGWDWRALLLAEGALGVVVLGGLAVATGSVVLRWAAVLSGPLLAGGIAAFTPFPAPVVLAVFAVAAELGAPPLPHWRLRRPPRPGRTPLVWAAMAGLAPVLGAAAGLGAAVVDAGTAYPTIVDGGPFRSSLGMGTLADLGLTGGSQVLGAPLAGLLAGVVLGRRAHRTQSSTLALLALAAVAVGGATSALASDLPARSMAVGLAATFVVVEVLALALRDDPFWSRPFAVVAAGGEVAAGAMTALAVQALFFGPALDSDRWASPGTGGRLLGLSFALGAVAWIAGDLRRYRGTPRPPGLALLRGGGWDAGTAAVAASAVLAVALATASGPAASATLIALTAVALAGRRPVAGMLAGAAGPWALLTSYDHPLAGSLVALAGAGVAAVAAVRRSSEDGEGGATLMRATLMTATPMTATSALATSAVVTATVAAAVAAPMLTPAATVAAAGVALWLVAMILDRADHGVRATQAGDDLGDRARTAQLVPLWFATLLASRSSAAGCALVALILVVDAVRLDRPAVGRLAALAAQAVVIGFTLSAGLGIADTGLALCVVAVAWAGLAAVVDDRWRPPFLVAAGAGLALGLLLAAVDPATLSSASLIAGGLLMAAGLALGQPAVGHGGGVLLCLGFGGHLALAGVVASEPYLAPVAGQLVIAGWQARRGRGTPSWMAYGPPVAVLGGAALAERLVGGAGWHALVAGGVGVMAVAVGGWRRLLGPLLAGTALVVAVTVNESFSALAGVPTWAWLGTAGVALLAVGVALERTDTTPADAGRRLVDVLAERYT